MSIPEALAKIERLRIDRDNLEGLYRTGLERRKAEDQRHLDELERVTVGFRAEIGRLEAELARLRRGPAVLIQEHTGKWHVFEDAKDAYAFEARTKIGPGYIRASVQEWHYYPKTEADPC